MQISVTPSMETCHYAKHERRREHSDRHIIEEHGYCSKDQLRKDVRRDFGNFYSQGRRKRKEKEKTYRSRTQADDRTIDKRNEGSRQIA